MSEIALVSARKSRLEADAKRGDKSAQTAFRLSNEPNKFFSTIQIGITLIGILTGLYSGEAFANDFAVIIQKIPTLSPFALIISQTVIVIVVTYLTLVFGELLPKRLGMNFAERVAKRIAKPMLIVSRIAYPIVWFLSKSTSLVLKMLGIGAGDDSKVTEEEIKAIVKVGMEDGEIEEVEHNIVKRVFNLGDRNVGSIMTHSSDLVWLDISDSNDVVLKKVQTDMHDVYPVASKRIDNILGVIFLKDLFSQINSPDFSLEQMISPIQYLPENKSVYNTLEQFKEARVKYGIVIDEFASIQGIVTLTDIMEALIGEVQDVGEISEIIEREDGSWLVDGQYSFYNFLEHFDVAHLYAENDYNTLSGLILEMLEHIPSTGEKLSWHNFGFEIIDMDGARIDKVLVTLIQ